MVTSASARSAAGPVAGPSPSERFARACAHLGFDNPEWCAPRRAAVLSALEGATRLTPSQLRTLVKAQRPRLTIREHGHAVSFDRELKAALGCLREEARLHGRLVALGQAWAGSNRLVALVTVHQPLLVTHVAATAVAGEVLCRVLDDVEDRRVFAHADEELLRRAWRAAHPLPPYFRRPART